jgi:hypothetical protein
LGKTRFTTGALRLKVNASLGVGVLEPDVVVTMTSTVPADSGGDVAIRRLSDSTVTLVAAVVPKATVASEVKSVPATKTLVPPVVGPWWGTTALTTGAGVVAPATPDDVIKTPTGRTAAQRTKPNLRYMMTSFIYDDAHAAYGFLIARATQFVTGCCDVPRRVV